MKSFGLSFQFELLRKTSNVVPICLSISSLWQGATVDFHEAELLFFCFFLDIGAKEIIDHP